MATGSLELATDACGYYIKKNFITKIFIKKNNENNILKLK